MNIMEMPEVISKLESLRSDFERHKEDVPFIERCLPVIDAVEEWKYSKSSYFSPLPYENELGGYSRGRLLRKKYSSPHEAEALGSYCFGFIGGEHRITISPSKSLTDSMHVALFDIIGGAIQTSCTTHYRRVAKAPQLRSLSEFFPIGDHLKADVGVGDQGAFSVNVYQYNNLGVPETVYAFSKRWLHQEKYTLIFDEAGELKMVKTGDAMIWSRDREK